MTEFDHEDPNFDVEAWNRHYDRQMERVQKRFPDFEWHMYSDTDVFCDIVFPLLDRVEELEKLPVNGDFFVPQ